MREDRLPLIDAMRRGGPQMLVAIVNRADSERATALLQSMRCHFLLSCLVKGTAGAGFADLMGFGPPEKRMLLCVAPHLFVQRALAALDRALQMHKRGRGIAFSIPIDGIALPARIPLDETQRARIQQRIESGVDEMLEGIDHDLVLAVVDEGHSEALVEQARAAGASGATVINARHLGGEAIVKFLGVPVQSEKEIVAILTTREGKAGIMEQIGAFFQQQPNSHGVLLSLPVDDVVGLAQ